MKLKLKTLSSIHIGGKEGNFLPMEYLIFRNKCYFINEDKLSKELYDRQLLDNFLTGIKQKGKDFSVDAFLKEKKLLTQEFLDKTSSYSSHCNINIQGNIRSCIRNAFSQPYLPGSAIKGVIRTSIMYVILKRLNDTLRKKILTDFVQKKLLEYKKDPRGEQGYSWFKERFKQWFAQRLDEEIFQKFVIKNNQKRYDPHSDILRCIQISDSNSIDTGNLHLEEVKIFSADSAKSPKDWSVFVECIPAGNEFTFQCKIDEWLLNKFKENNPSNSFGVAFSELKKILSNPFEAVNEMTSDLLREEESFFSQKLKLKNILNFGNETPNFRLGWGMGLLGTSVAMLLPAETKQDLRNILFTDRGDSPAPKSRRIITSNHSSYAILGWCVVENNI